MRTRDIVTGLVVLALLLGGIFWVKRTRTKKEPFVVPTPTVEEKIGKTFNGLEIPKDAEKAELKDVSGGNGVGIATREMVLADLPDPESGKSYQVWADDKLLGSMRVAKGGFLFEGKIEGKKVQVRLGPKVILEGAF